MRLEIEGFPPVENADAAYVSTALLGLRSYAPPSFASLTDDTGSYVQVGGGRVTCVLERRDTNTGRHYRAYHDTPSKIFAEGTVLSFSGQRIRLAPDEWFTAPMVLEVFLAFLEGREFPSPIQWRDITDIFTGDEKMEHSMGSFVPGATVILKSGSPIMTIRWIRDGDAYCEWFEGATVKGHLFALSQLQSEEPA